LTHSDADAEDALQETFLQAWTGADSFRGDAPPRAWLFGIARNVGRRMYRRRVGEPSPTDTVSFEALGLAAGWGSDRAGTLEQLCTRDSLERGFAALEPEDREILVLRELEGFTGSEAADLLGLSPAAQKSRLHRARLRLAAELQESCL